MEHSTSSARSKWSLAAKDGLILAAVTVMASTLTFLTENKFLDMLLWIVKLGGSIWLLSVIMKRYGKAHPEESTFSYGLIVCVLSALVCAVWTFIEYQFLFPAAVAKAFEQMYASIGQMGAMVPDEFTDMMLKMEDNYAQINCVSSFLWCTLLGLVFSAILARSTSGRRGIFTPEEMQNKHESF